MAGSRDLGSNRQSNGEYDHARRVVLIHLFPYDDGLSSVRGVGGNEAGQFGCIWFTWIRSVTYLPQRQHFAVGLHAFENTSLTIIMALMPSGRERQRRALNIASRRCPHTWRGISRPRTTPVI